MIRVLTGPSSTVDPDNLVRWCTEWARECDVEARTSFASDEDALVGALAPEALQGASGVVLDPADCAASSRVHAAARHCGVPVAWVDVLEAERPRPPYLELATTCIRGRGVHGYRWALLHLLQRVSWPYEVVPYGPEGRDQVADLRLPADGPGPYPVAILLHGGFWRERWERDTIEPLAVDLATRGVATWNVEYRRVGPFGGGWPSTCEDVALAIDHVAELADLHPLDLDRVVLLGHSAGGQLGLWAAKRPGVARPPRIRPRLVVSLAGVADLVECARRGLGDTGNGAAAFMGASPESAPEPYRLASPMAGLPLEVPQLVVQGRLDNIPDLVDLTHRYVRAARAAGDTVELVELDDADHFDLIDPSSPAWASLRERIAPTLPEVAAESGPVSNPTARGLADRVREAALELPPEAPPGHAPDAARDA